MCEHLHILITGGTIDSIFDSARDMVVVNDSSTLLRYIEQTIKPNFTISQEVITMRDSRDITDNIRTEIVRSIEKCPHDFIIITHGTYTMAETACFIENNLKNKTKKVVLTGSMLPLQGFAPSDAPFNLGFAIGCVFNSAPGVYLAMNGKLFSPTQANKNITEGRFESI